jgi:hypothetical protein
VGDFVTILRKFDVSLIHNLLINKWPNFSIIGFFITWKNQNKNLLVISNIYSVRSRFYIT